MKKVLFAISMAVIIGFTAAVGLCVRVLVQPQSVAAFSDGGMRIVLDAGHGGIDGGVVGKKTGIKESDINLAVTYRLKEALEDMGFEITLTRKTEAGLYGTTAKGFKKRDMQKRKEIIEETDPALVLSVHQNFYPSSASRGGQVFYKDENEGSQNLALKIQESLNTFYAQEGAKERNAAAGDYFMLKCTDRPSVIVECGFLSNPADEALLSGENGQKRIAQSIAAGVFAYFSDSAS